MDMNIGKNFKARVLKLLHKFDRYSEFINDFLDSVQKLVNRLSDMIVFLWTLNFFDKLDNEGCAWWAKLLDIEISNTLPLTDKQALIRAKWRASGHNTLKLIQNVCDSWTDKKLTATFLPDDTTSETGYHNGKIGLEFGKEEDIAGAVDITRVLKMINEVKPAHLPLVLRYILTLKNRFFIGTSLLEVVIEEVDCRRVL